jgi:hypothetical protein
VSLKPELDSMCDTCNITLLRKANRGKTKPSSYPKKPGRMVVADIICNPFKHGLTDASHFEYYIFFVNVASIHAPLLGLNLISSFEVQSSGC